MRQIAFFCEGNFPLIDRHGSLIPDIRPLAGNSFAGIVCDA
jgi:hypothetical protein